jgi:hypothetical protein
MALRMEEETFNLEIQLSSGAVVEVSVVENEEVELWLRPNLSLDGTKVYEGAISEDMRS